jgi:hypothetical protein
MWFDLEPWQGKKYYEGKVQKKVKKEGKYLGMFWIMSNE